MSKDDYILRALSKISHKRWEHYIINRIFHRLNDPDLEFVCQQCIRKEGHSGKIYLADLLFPQLKLYLEIDEAHHDSDEAKMADGIRRLDIMEATGFIEKRIPANNTTLDKINHLVDEFILLVRDRKAQQEVK
ncbi:AbaSI family restriction endonuclease [Providencia huaxiensis]|uniref:AbaSI family restriction endonuclease n=2 Tax=Providencia TaxID=586 RepID=UPI0034E44986